jgi:hypothetical protein
MYNRNCDICYSWLSYRKCVVMNVDHFGIFVTFIVLAVLLSVVFISQSNIQIFPTETATHTGFAGYCEKMNLKC